MSRVAEVWASWVAGGDAGDLGVHLISIGVVRDGGGTKLERAA